MKPASMKGAPVGAQLERLDVAPGPDGLLVQFKAKGTLSPHVATLDSPARIVVDLPNTALATAQTHIAVGHDGVKDVRLGVDGQPFVTDGGNYIVDCHFGAIAEPAAFEAIVGKAKSALAA